MTTRHLLSAAIFLCALLPASAQRFRHVEAAPDTTEHEIEVLVLEDSTVVADDILIFEPTHSELDSIRTSAVFSEFPPQFELPKVFNGYRKQAPLPPLYVPATPEQMMARGDSIYQAQMDSLPPLVTDDSFRRRLQVLDLKNAIHNNEAYRFMYMNPESIDYLYWELPEPPKLAEEKFSNPVQRISPITGNPLNNAVIWEVAQERRNWLHYFNTALQFSQAYVSKNWYQGGDNYLALLFNFTWNVDLNPVYYPNILFQSQLSYKLALNSNPKESIHKVNISQDNFQYNLNAGFKAFKHWYYSFSLQFKTPLLNAYPADGTTRKGAFLSPGSLNLGLGMTYTKENAKKTFKFAMSIAPISYNLKTCIVEEIDHAQYNIDPGKSTTSEIGSNLEANMRWQICPAVQWTSRLFLFSDYKYFLGDWENTFDFKINKFLSTQIYLHPRFDSSSDRNSSSWGYWMLKEILSFGLSYTFSTKQ